MDDNDTLETETNQLKIISTQNDFGSLILIIGVSKLYVECLYFQKRFGECLSVAYNAELACYRISDLKRFPDHLIPIQDSRHVFNYFQQFIYNIHFKHHHKALFVAEQL